MFWYNYPNPKLSFFLSGKDNFWFDIDYVDFAGKSKTTPMHPNLTDTPAVYTVILDSYNIDKLNIKISHYTGVINISDIFLNGRPLKDLKPVPADGLNILSNHSNNLSVSLQDKAEISLCSDCYLPKTKVFKHISEDSS